MAVAVALFFYPLGYMENKKDHKDDKQNAVFTPEPPQDINPSEHPVKDKQKNPQKPDNPKKSKKEKSKR